MQRPKLQGGDRTCFPAFIARSHLAKTNLNRILSCFTKNCILQAKLCT